MRKTTGDLTITDQFCGAGGSSLGIRNISRKNGGGISVKLAMNHWALAIKTHQTNFPDTDHDCTDISACDPRRYESTDGLVTSPECTNHSLAKNKKRVKKQLNMFDTQKAQEERSRATMWDVPRFAEYHKYKFIVTENVVDAKRWVQYPAWLHAMELLGYSYKECYLNSMHFPPTPQSRDRMYVVFWKKGNKAPLLDYMPLAYCSKCCKNVNAIQTWKPNCLPYGKYRTQYIYQCPCGTVVEPYYYAAMNCIDWSIKSERIGDREKPLVDNTMVRIQKGIDMYWNTPFIIYGSDLKNKGRIYDLRAGLPTQCGQPMHSIISPLIAHSSNQHGNIGRIQPAMDAEVTQTTTQDGSITMPPVPFIMTDHNSSVNSSYREMQQAIFTQCTEKHDHLIYPPFAINARHTEGDDSTIKPLGTQVAQVSHGFIQPPFLSNSAYGGTVDKIDKPFDALTTHQNNDLITPPFVVRNCNPGHWATTEQPIGTQIASAQHSIITSEAWQAFIGYYYGEAYESHVTDPLGTVTTKERNYLATMPAGQKIDINDCFYRMIRSKEVGAAMAFDDDYIVLGNERQKVKQYGNAVTPPVMQWLAEMCINSLL